MIGICVKVKVQNLKLIISRWTPKYFSVFYPFFETLTFSFKFKCSPLKSSWLYFIHHLRYFVKDIPELECFLSRSNHQTHVLWICLLPFINGLIVPHTRFLSIEQTNIISFSKIHLLISKSPMLFSGFLVCLLRRKWQMPFNS